MTVQIRAKVDNILKAFLSKRPLTPNQQSSFVCALERLAFNLTAHSPDESELKQSNPLNPPRQMLPSAFEKAKTLAALFRGFPQLNQLQQYQVSTDEEKKGKIILGWAETAGFLVSTEKLVFFRDAAFQTYFCVSYCRKQTLSPLFLKKIAPGQRFKNVWKLWAALDPLLIPKLVEISKLDPGYTARALAFIGTPDTFNPLLQILFDKSLDKSARLHVLSVFEQFIEKVDLPVAEAFYNLIIDVEQHPHIRGSAAHTLGKYSDVALPYLIAAFRSENEETRVYAVEGLGKLSPNQSLEYLFAALKDECVKVRKYAISYLAFYTDTNKLSPQMLEQYRENFLKAEQDSDETVRLYALEILAQINHKPAIQTLCDLILKERKPSSCFEILEVLALINEPEVVPTLIKLLSCPERQVAAEVARILKLRNEKQAIQPLLLELNESFNSFVKSEEEADFRYAATYTLISFGVPEILDLLLAAYHQGKIDIGLKMHLATALVKFNHPQAFTILNTLFYDETRNVCIKAAEALVDLKGAEILPFFCGIINENKGSLNQQEAAIYGLARLGNEEATAILLPALKSDNKQLRFAAIVGLRKIKCQEAIPALEWIKWNEEYGGTFDLRYRAAEAIDYILGTV
ncbi:MAG TPA: HEAT repeat domain-containing protein [Chloroflexia bacterium]|nr:HEAT repeat domain-containing protein [Chloroflexia bacterium]